MNHSTIAYSPPLCVWKVVEESASGEKLPIIRSLIGESKVEYASDLRLELETLVEIWYELTSGTVLAVHYSKRKSGLPEPPQQREMLIREIQLLLDNLKDKESGGLASVPSNLDETVINYTNHITEQRTPPSTAPVLRSLSRNSPSPALTGVEIGDVAKNIPVLDNETPIEALRNAIQCECEILLEDIEYIRRCIEEGRCDFEEVIEPSLMELRQERKKLESHLMKSIELTPSPSRKNSKLGGVSSPTRLRRNAATVSRTRTLPPVRPSSATQFPKPAKLDYRQTLEPSPQRVDPKSSTSPVLGARSYTYPTETGIKSTKQVKRRNSVAGTLSHKNLFKTDLAGSPSAFDSGFDSLSGRRVFCGTPDSGVSSRAPSEMGMVDGAVSDSLEHLKSLSKHYSEMHLATSSAIKTNHNAALDETWYRSTSDEIGVAPKHDYVHQLGAASGKSMIPKPPTQSKPRTMQNARLHKVKASGLPGS